MPTVVCSSAGVPGFRKLYASAVTSNELCLRAFDLLHLNGRDLGGLSLNFAAEEADVPQP